jgi:hypothetical protein
MGFFAVIPTGTASPSVTFKPVVSEPDGTVVTGTPFTTTFIGGSGSGGCITVSNPEFGAYHVGFQAVNNSGSGTVSVSLDNGAGGAYALASRDSSTTYLPKVGPLSGIPFGSSAQLADPFTYGPAATAVP